MKLTSEEQAMLDGAEGPAVQKAMDLLVRYGEALGAERLVETNNVAGVIGSSSQFIESLYDPERSGNRDIVFSRFDLDSDEAVEIPKARTVTCHLQTRIEPTHWQEHGVAPDAMDFHIAGQEYAAEKGVQMLNTCTPHVAGNEPKRGEHCAWMESSAVVYINSVIGARTNTEGRESAAAAMLTRRIPYWGYHMPENRFGTHRIDVAVPIESVMDWGMLGYFVGDAVQDDKPVLTGITSKPELIHHKHFGAAAASSGGVELYHVVGLTPEAETVDHAFGPQRPVETLSYGKAERRATWEKLNAAAHEDDVQYVMLGCPHYTLEQIGHAAALLEGKRISANARLWIFTSRAIKQQADTKGYSRTIEKAGGLLMTDTCSAMSTAVPKGTRTAATDSAKQTHYLPAIVGVDAWFGSTEDCVDAALTGKFRGEAP